MDPSLGVAGEPWRAQEVAARHVKDLPVEELVLELGSGCGGLAAFLALEGYQVIATDFDKCQSLVAQTAKLNGVHVDFYTLPWGDLAAMEGLLNFSKGARMNLVACELAYWGGWSILEEDPLEALAETIAFFLKNLHGSCLLVYEARNRPRELRLFELLGRHHLEWTCLEDVKEDGDMGAWLLKEQEGQKNQPEAKLLTLLAKLLLRFFCLIREIAWLAHVST